MVMMRCTLGRTYCEGGGSVQVKNLVEDPLFFEAAKYPIECHTIYFSTQNFLQFGLGYRSFFGIDNLQNTQSRLGNFELAGA